MISHLTQGPGKITARTITSLTIIITTHLPKCEEKFGAPLQIIAGKTFCSQYSIFSLLSASLQCCLVAWSSSSIVQGYQSMESLLRPRPRRAQAQEGVELGTSKALGTGFETLQNSSGKLELFSVTQDM